MGSVVKSVTKGIKKVAKAPKKIIKEVSKAPKLVGKTAKKVVKEVSKAPKAATKLALEPVVASAESGADFVSKVAPALNKAAPAIATGASLYATGGLSGGLFNGLAGSGQGGSSMGFFDGLLDSAGDILKGSGADFLNNALGLNGNQPGSSPVPAETILNQTNKSIAASQAQTSQAIEASNQKMMMIMGGGLAAVVALMFLTKKR